MGAVHGHGCCPSHPRSGRTSLQGLTVMMRFQQAAATTTTCLDPPRQRQPGEEATKRSGVNTQNEQADPAQPGQPLSSRDADSPSAWQKPPARPAPIPQARGAKLWDENPAAHQVKPCQAERLHFCAFQGLRTPKQPTATSRTGQGPETAQASWGQTPQQPLTGLQGALQAKPGRPAASTEWPGRGGGSAREKDLHSRASDPWKTQIPKEAEEGPRPSCQHVQGRGGTGPVPGD